MTSRALKVFLSAGEASGDIHGANLIRELKRRRPDLVLYGLGGPRMAEVGCALHEDMVKRSGMWFWHVWTNFFHYLRVLREVVSGFVTDPPDAVVLIDSPGFNVRVAAHAKARGIPVIYYITPQTWAWASMRFPKIARRVDKMLNILPFEPELWRAYGVDCEYVGHPLFDHLASLTLSPVERVESAEAPLIGLLPGSRARQVDDLLPIMLRAAEVIKREIPKAEFRLACANGILSERIRRIIQCRTRSSSPVSIDITEGSPYDLMRQATLCLVACGTANLELAYFRTPMVVLYRMVWYGFWVIPPYMSTDYMSLVNILAGRELVPECLLMRDDYKRVAMRVLELLQDSHRRKACIAGLDDFCARFAHPGATARVAEAVLKVISET